MIFTFCTLYSFSTVDLKLGLTSTRAGLGLAPSFSFTSLLESSTPSVTSTYLVSFFSKFSAVSGASSGSNFFSLPGSTTSSTLELCMEELMGISSDHPGAVRFLKRWFEKGRFQEICYNTSILLFGNIEILQWLLMKFALMCSFSTTIRCNIYM